MKKVILLQRGVASLAVGLMILGCGGGGSSDDSSSSSSSRAVLDDQQINKLGENAAKVLPGCSYNANSVNMLNGDKSRSYKVVLDSVKKREKKFQKNTIDEIEAGSCGGTVTTKGEYDNGETDVIYSFNNYCEDDVVLNGSTHIVMDSASDESDSEIDSIKVSTQSGGIEVRTVEDGVTMVETIYIDNLKWEKSGSIVMDELKVVSADGTYKVNDVNALQNLTAETLEIKSATYYDPDIGAVTVTTSPLPSNSETAGSATITVTGSEGSAVFKTDDITSKLFTTTNAEGTVVGALDCSALYVEL